jgi:mRNA-degrading endonuclease RelE of RelBE toxin-antitoxin system
VKYRIQIRKQALKEIEQLPIKIIKQINEAIECLADDPRPHRSKKLKGDKEYL